ncbi:hypothetical protein [Arenibacter troitsensis]|uniref:Uncharacterized protein n=1 Tax=Arenibacter troitsensis TaxID=188872 RepID=A0A1X7JAW2_9FLAO|nr:hypothetical protein [Arenibacter troitsensis]SMG24690.1 hypothetical protein SAMN03080602_01573 [Arenibacter troitsensis]
MKKVCLLFFSLFIFSVAQAKDDCELIYSTASYALNHAKSALKANNFDHQKYYSEKALESYEKLFKLLEGSQCEGLSEKVQDIIADALKAADPADWDRGRYYSKKVFTSTQDLISLMDSRTEVAGVDSTD